MTDGLAPAEVAGVAAGPGAKRPTPEPPQCSSSEQAAETRFKGVSSTSSSPPPRSASTLPPGSPAISPTHSTPRTLKPPISTPQSPPKSPPSSSSKRPSQSPPELPLQPVPVKPSKARKVSAPDASHGAPASSGKPATAGWESPSVVYMRRWLQTHRIWMCRCTLTSTLALLAAAVLVFACFRQDIFYPSELFGRPSLYLCSKAAEEVRATLNFTVDPCDDFYSFVCSAGGHFAERQGRDFKGPVRGEGTAFVWEDIQWKLMSVPWETDRQGVENKASRFFRSCRRLVAAPTVYVKEHADVLFAVVPEVSVDLLRQADRPPERTLELLAVVSLKYGISGSLSFAPGPKETRNLVAVRPPLSTHLDDIDLRLVLVDTVEMLQLAYDVAAHTVQRLLEIDRDLREDRASPSQQEREPLGNFEVSMTSVPGKDERGTTGTRRHVNVSPRNGQEHNGSRGAEVSSSPHESRRDSSGSSAGGDVIETFLPPPKYRVQVGDLEAVRRALRALFVDMNAAESATYLLAYMLLPEDLLLTYANRNHKAICYKLLRFAFRDVWGFLATRVSLAVTHTGNARFITEAVLATLKDASTRRGDNRHSASVTADKIAKLLASLSRDKNSAEPRSMEALGSMDVRSLYRNIIEIATFRRRSMPRDDSVNSTNADAIGRDQAQLRVPVEDLAPPSYCQGAFRFLNYATFGVSVALEVFRALGGLFSDAGARPSTRTASGVGGVRPVRPCFAAEIASLPGSALKGGTSRERQTLLDEVISWATAFRLALAASKLERARAPREVVESDMLKAFFARYCYHLCARAEDPFDAARWPKLKCNIAVTNVPEFASLFNCKQDKALFRTEYCSAL
ncbi:uncharacterized protein [Dermacentor albipictus]|uniref:uncharacterized protein n=1 Tax=Dermacentor albipictus TaxID=60249 RepID=UPI0031FC85F3